VRELFEKHGSVKSVGAIEGMVAGALAAMALWRCRVAQSREGQWRR